jgi:hypothetical protein
MREREHTYTERAMREREHTYTERERERKHTHRESAIYEGAMTDIYTSSKREG